MSFRPCDIVCGLCQKGFHLPDGCRICEPCKANILWPAVDPTHMPDMQTAIARTMNTCLEMLGRFEEEAGLGKAKGESLGARKQMAFGKWANQIATITKALTAAVGEARKLDAKHRHDFSRMNFEDKTIAICKWVHHLPGDYKGIFGKSVAKVLTGQLRGRDIESQLEFDA